MPYLTENITTPSQEEDSAADSLLTSDSENDEYVPPPPPPGEDKVEDENIGQDSLFGDSEDEYIPPPPPRDDENSEDDDDMDSLASTNDDNPIQQANQQNNLIPEYYGDDEDDEDEDDEDDDEYDPHYLQKFDHINKKNIIEEYHPELVTHNYDEVETLSKVVRNEQGIIIDPLHKTLPFLTKYERARVLGERSKQLNLGAKPLVEIGPDIIDGYLIALREFEEKKIPFIIKRPMPNGGCEYWKMKDLEMI